MPIVNGTKMGHSRVCLCWKHDDLPLPSCHIKHQVHVCMMSCKTAHSSRLTTSVQR